MTEDKTYTYDFSRHLDYKKFEAMIEQLEDHEKAKELQAVAREDGYLGKTLVDLVIPEPQWAIKGWLASGLNGLLAGQPKTFKSTMMLDMAFSLATGHPFLGLYRVEADPTPVIYIQEENTIQDMRKHFHSLYERAGAGESWDLSYPTAKREFNLHHVFQWDPNGKRFEHDVRAFTRRGWAVEDDALQWLGQKIIDEGVRWVFIDPLYKITPPGMSLNNDETISLMTRKLDGLSEQTGANIIVVHHQNKDKSAKGGGRVMGSNLIWGWAGQTLWVDRGQEVETVRNGERQVIHRIIVEHDFRSMAPLRSHTYLEYFGNAEWFEIRREQANTGGRPKSTAKADAIGQFRVHDAQDVEIDVALFAKEYGKDPKTIRNWIAESRKTEVDEL